MTLGWELYWRKQGYEPSLNDNKDLWALNRERLDKNPKLTTVIGSSRILFGLNLNEWKKEFGEKPLQLSTVASNVTVYLHHLAHDSNFSGTLIMGVDPYLFFAPSGAPMDIPTGNIEYYKKFSWAQRWSHHIGIPLDKNLAFLEQDDLPLKNLLERLPLPLRKNVKEAPPIPPYFVSVDADRQGLMIKKVETDPAFRAHMIAIWKKYFTPPPLPKGVTEQEFMKQNAEHVGSTLKKVAESIKKIQDRGGKVIMVRYPSTGHVRQMEATYTPRQQFWNRIITETHANMSVHFEDFETLKNFQCPEESHLNGEDAVLFTKELIKILKEKGL